jgi:hypothetical protein
LGASHPAVELDPRLGDWPLVVGALNRHTIRLAVPAIARKAMFFTQNS